MQTVYTPYDQVTFDPLEFITHIPDFEESETSTGFCDLSDLLTRFKEWYGAVPSICPILVLRRNDDPHIIKIASNYGCRFSCSSRGEIEELCKIGVATEKIFWSNSCISLSDCTFARVAKINRIQVGRSSALYNIKSAHPNASVILNVSLPSPSIDNDRGHLNFSHTEQEFEDSLLLAKELNLKICGITLSKNVNWNSNDLNVKDVFKKAKELVELAESLGFKIESLTVPEVIKDVSLEAILSSLKEMNEYANAYLNKPGMKIYCETHDSLTTSTLSIFMTVQAVRRIDLEDNADGKMEYFVDDGNYNSFRKAPRSIRYSEVRYIRRNSMGILNDSRLFATDIYGPSCDGDDVVLLNVQLPELRNGDLIYFTNMGTDTFTTRTGFNGMLSCNRIYFINKEDLNRDYDKEHWEGY